MISLLFNTLSRLIIAFLFAAPWTLACQSPLSIKFSRKKYWSGLPLPSPMTKLDCVLKSKGIILLTKAHIVKAMVFSQLQMQELDHWRIDAFELWCWRRFMRVPWTARRSNQSILKEISPEYSLEGVMLKLKL